ncbi:MAG: protoheme IX farnesyltransferase [Candidatus Latescibacteria bacterium]|nr:protoheme IX farnesyltransferase [Candidatus Latescibacterota bacterium]
MANETRGNAASFPFAAYFELTKPRILTLVLVTTALGFFLGGRGVHSLPLLFYTLMGTAWVVGGAAVLNHYLERDVDGAMERTRNRPLPAGIIKPSTAMSYGLCLVLGGVAILLLGANLLTAFLALLSAFLYVVVYTPMKRLTWLNTSIGAIPGALPPVGGWTAATGQLEWGALALFLILFAWQHPHFYAIAWIFREDYQRGGFKMLPVVEPEGQRTCRHIIAFSVLLIGVSVLPTVLHLTGQFYLYGAVLMGLGLLAAGISLSRSRSELHARRLLRASVAYLPLLFLLCAADTGF